jgi:nicotinate-nucleotide adenylyltransferase
MRKIGILGGSFDPIHCGHLNIAQSAYDEYHLDEVWFVPAAHSPNKDELRMTPFANRLAMAKLATKDVPYFRVSDIESEYEGTSYTYRTLRYLCETYPKTQFYFIMGADSLDYFETWCHPELICRYAILLVAVRDQFDSEIIQKKMNVLQQQFGSTFYAIAGGKTDVSSTEVRHLIQSRDSCTDQIPAPVLEYIKEHGLYL